ncbi:MAG: hypothetical protein K9H25_13685 [Rhodospirillum sp.]|nr:hypothetical protein [Rhodospirillum sp.]MCF8487813.1 hypothetical protein [Rhodospirillum sp.]MCF8499911.1 hypothetical protein [Rhodospirillum sp.]
MIRLLSGSLVVYYSDSFSDEKRLDGYIKKLGQRFPNRIFITYDQRVRHALPQMQLWRHFLSTSEELVFYERGRLFLSDWMSSLNDTAKDILEPFHPALVSIAFRAHVIADVGARPDVVQIVCGPANLHTEFLKKSSFIRNFRQKILYVWLRPFINHLFPATRPYMDSISLGSFIEASHGNSSSTSGDLVWTQTSKIDGTGPLCLGILEDSGSNLNFTPGRDVFQKLSNNQKFRTIVLSSSPRVVDALRDEGIQSYRLPFAPFPHDSESAFNRFSATLNAVRTCSASGNTYEVGIFRNLVEGHLYSWALVAGGTTSAAKDIAARYSTPVLLSINEQISSAIAASRAIKSARWVGYSPALMFNHPESKFFPADIHLVYGEQLTELINNTSNPAPTVEVVGSAIFDRALNTGISKDAYNQFKRENFPGWTGEPVLSIGTENRSGQIKDIASVLKQLNEIDNIYVVIKVHPEDSASEFQEIAEEILNKTKYLVRKDLALEPLLAASELLICMRSNIIVTAALLGTPTLVCDFSGSTEIIDFAEEGIAEKCDSQEQLAGLISEFLDPIRKTKILEKILSNVHRFNGQNDGRSAERVENFIQHLMAESKQFESPEN